MRVLIGGSSGMIAGALRRRLEADGHDVLRLVRRAPAAPDEFAWRPENHALDPRLVDDVDAVVNLSGASLARLPWTPAYRREIVASRVSTTRTLADAILSAAHPPSVFVSASAVGYYGDRPGETLTERSSRGTGFLADLVERWEGEAHAADAATRVVTARTGLVMAAHGALRPLIPVARLGLAGPLGGGRQHWPWIALRDEVAAIAHLLASSLSGPVNLVGATAATAGEVIASLAAELHRPAVLPVPRPLIGMLGEAGRELLLADQHVVPERLAADGFSFAHPTVDSAIAEMLGDRPDA
jgi:TIGR01777 family protein